MKNQYIGENCLKKGVRLAQFADLRGIRLRKIKTYFFLTI